MTAPIATIADVREAEPLIRPYFSPAPLIRSYPLEKALGLGPDRRVWIKDYGWTPVGSFKLMGALNWMAHHADEIGTRPVAACSSGNFASGIAFAGQQFGKHVVVVMPDTAPRIKFNRTQGFGAEVVTYDISRDHITGDRERLTREIAIERGGVQASPYNDRHVIAGNGVGGLEIVDDLRRSGRELAQFFCPVSGGGLLAGHALAIADGFPKAEIIAAEPSGADDFSQSLATGERTRIDKPDTICDGLRSYDVGEQNWPILKELVTKVVTAPDLDTQRAMRWMYEQHGLRTEPSGAIGIAALLSGRAPLTDRPGDIVVVLSGRNVDEPDFRKWIDAV